MRLLLLQRQLLVSEPACLNIMLSIHQKMLLFSFFLHCLFLITAFYFFYTHHMHVLTNIEHVSDLSARSLGQKHFYVSNFNIGSIDGAISIIVLFCMLYWPLICFCVCCHCSLCPVMMDLWWGYWPNPSFRFSFWTSSPFTLFILSVSVVLLLFSIILLTSCSFPFHSLLYISSHLSLCPCWPSFLSLSFLSPLIVSVSPFQPPPPPALFLCREARPWGANPCWIPTTQVHSLTHTSTQIISEVASSLYIVFFFYSSIFFFISMPVMREALWSSMCSLCV